MFEKRSLIALLAGVNILLFLLLVAASYSPTAAFAQKGGRAGSFSCVTAKAAGQTYDAVYVLDRPERKLHVFYPADSRGTRYTAVPSRDLDFDFRRQGP
ncbi:MAG: hypothetical protein IIB57_08070 [Planctomycetes bacterium]|nr:hypothetical protein [Planctomycetota bacterium]